MHSLCQNPPLTILPTLYLPTILLLSTYHSTYHPNPTPHKSNFHPTLVIHSCRHIKAYVPVDICSPHTHYVVLCSLNCIDLWIQSNLSSDCYAILSHIIRCHAILNCNVTSSLVPKYC